MVNVYALKMFELNIIFFVYDKILSKYMFVIALIFSETLE